MALRFQTASQRLDVGVADLLRSADPGSLRVGAFGSPERMRLGVALHIAYQTRTGQADESFRSEVQVARTMTVDGWNATVHGRIDGTRRDPDGHLVIEEIKTVRPGATPDQRTRESYCLQARLYAWILEPTEEKTIHTELIWIDTSEELVRRERLPPESQDTGQFVTRCLREWIDAHEREEAERHLRRSAGRSLRFPHLHPRPGQEAIGKAVTQALENGEHLLIEARPGTGKTAAVLHPVLRHALCHDRRAFLISTRTTQQAMAMGVLDRLARDAPLPAVQIRAKRRMCANAFVLCHEDACRHARDHGRKLTETRIVERLLEGRHPLHPQEIFARADRHVVCPFELSLELAARAPAVVADLNYVFDPRVALQGFAPGVPLDDTILVIDEIHGLLPRLRQAYGASVSAPQVRAVLADLGLGGARIHEEIGSATRELEALLTATAEEFGPTGDGATWALEAELPEALLLEMATRLERLFPEYLAYRLGTRSLEAEDPFLALHFSLQRFLQTLEFPAPAFRPCVEVRGGDIALRVLCLDPRAVVAPLLDRFRSVIGMSATLQPMEIQRRSLGLAEERTAWISLPSPFPPEQRRIVIDPSVRTAWRYRAREIPRIAKRVAAFAEAVEGHCLAVFPSFELLGAVSDRGLDTTRSLLRQRRDDGEAERRQLLDRLAEPGGEPCLVLTVAGGVLTEGVDYPGDMLRGVLVVGPCLPPPDLARELLRELYEDELGAGFELAYVVPGMTRVVQAAGRLLRSAEDTGVIALLGRRFLQPPYRDLLPEDWLQGRDPESLAGDPAQAATEFFRDPPRG